MKGKKNIAIVCAGDSGEYKISLKSARMIASNIDTRRFNPFVITIRKNRWEFKSPEGEIFPINRNDFSLNVKGKIIHFDGVFNIIHGTPGEDGKLQGYLEMLGIPYTSCDWITSALTFNKVFCKMAARSLGALTSDWIHLQRNEEYSEKDIIKTLGLPCFVKPANGGSSLGISKVKTIKDLKPAIEKAFHEDNQVIIESFIPGTEITCGAIQTKSGMIVFQPTMVVPRNEFFDYEAKYTKGMSEEITPAPIAEELSVECRRLTSWLYRKLNCRGVVRIDYILNDKGFHFLEVNSIPGMSEMSIVPQQARDFGLNMTELISLIIDSTI